MAAVAAVSCALLLSVLCGTPALVVPNGTAPLRAGQDASEAGAAPAAPLGNASLPKARRKRYISQNDMIAILDYHNQVRGKVFPPAANMEYMVSELLPAPEQGSPASLASRPLQQPGRVPLSRELTSGFGCLLEMFFPYLFAVAVT